MLRHLDSTRIAIFSETSVKESKTIAPLWKSFSQIFAGTLVYVLSQWGMISVLSKLGSPEVVGVFSLGLAITAPIILFAGLQLRQVQATDAKGDYSFGEYLGLRFITTTLALAVIAGVVLVAGYSRETVLVILAVAAAKTFEAISETFYGFLQNRERMDVVSRSLMIKGPLSLLSLGAVFYLTHSLFWAIVAMAGSWAVLLVCYDIRKSMPLIREVWEDSDASPSLRYGEYLHRTSRLAWLTLPLGIAIAFNSLTVNIPRYLIEYYSNAHALGIFAAIAYILVSSRLVSGALGQSASPRLARYYAGGERPAFLGLLLRLSLVSAAIGIAGIIVALVAGRWILSLLYTPEYAGYVDLFVLVMVATALNHIASLFNFAMTATRRLRSQTAVQAGTVIVTVIWCVVLIPQAGITGAGVALVISKLFQLVAAFGIVVYALGALPEATAISEAGR